MHAKKLFFLHLFASQLIFMYTYDQNYHKDYYHLFMIKYIGPLFLSSLYLINSTFPWCRASVSQSAIKQGNMEILHTCIAIQDVVSKGLFHLSL